MGSPYASPALSEESIRSLIHFRGGLPVEHRMIAWKYLLQLPSNSGAFTRQVSKGPYPAAFASLSERYPLRDRRLFRKMAVIVSSLAHWSPILADVEFLPSWVFPFVVVFFQDDLGAFEASMTFFLHWGSRLLVTFPQPPVPVLASIELMLRRTDRELASHLTALSMGALSYGWPLLRSAFSEVLTTDGWLLLFDRILANKDTPEMLEAAVVAFVMASRAQFLACTSTVEAEAIIRRQQPSTNLQEMFRVMERVSKFGAPAEWRAQGHVMTGRRKDRRDGVTTGTAAASTSLRAAPQRFTPIPRGMAYPFYDGHPQHVVNYQIKLRERVIEQELEMEHKSRLVAELTHRAHSIASREYAVERLSDV